ncbi:MAG: Fe(2+)-trafficking protein [Phycisphaerales bacterium]|jgi:Fe-S cluster biosynthesis and repair protein YggX|nr:Fe(2+)-trafficking protein [Phycisphaerales bacterium]
MDTAADRIAQFENMASADPENEMAHFSLGSAYLQAGRPADAAASLERCIELSPEMSKAYELCGQAMLAAGWEDRAAEVLTRGFQVAAGRGDRMPQDAIAGMLTDIGRAVPEVSADAPPTSDGEGDFVCQRTGRGGTQLSEPPFRGPVGDWISQHISAETWDAWIHQGTKVINELRLDLSQPQDTAMYDQHMHEYLGVPEDVASADGA